MYRRKRAGNFLQNHPGLERLEIPEISLVFSCAWKGGSSDQRGEGEEETAAPTDGVGPLLVWESGRCGLGRGRAGRAFTGVPPSGGETVPCWWGSGRQLGGTEGKPCRGSAWLVAPSRAATVLILTSAFTTALSSSNMDASHVCKFEFPSSHIKKQKDEIVQYTLCDPVYRKPYFMSIENEIVYWRFYAKSWKPVCSFTLSSSLN